MVPRLLALAAAMLVGSPSVHAGSTLDAVAGKALFERNWVSSPSTTRSDAGLGPLYDARSCNACHAGAGPGQLSNPVGAGTIVRLGHTEGMLDQRYGSQLQTHALPGITPEAKIRLAWKVEDGLRVPHLKLSAFGYGALEAETHVGLRRAPSLAGIAQLAAIPEDEVLSVSLREHANGISGHPAWLTDSKGQSKLGRWGWKASVADLPEQVAQAMRRDIGVSTTLHPEPWGECTVAERMCRNAAQRGNRIEAADEVRTLILAYLSSMPAPTPLSEMAGGFEVFQRIGCGGCHTTLTNAKGERVHDYTDLLLHDLGPDLGDGIAEGDATGQEWRTAPLWNIPEELRAGGLLHDGRARSIAEATAWHGGAAASSRMRFAALTASERTAIEDFLLHKK